MHTVYRVHTVVVCYSDYGVMISCVVMYTLTAHDSICAQQPLCYLHSMLVQQEHIWLVDVRVNA
jgi:hypothetical protein